jgi:hypothetical protein
MRRKQEAIMSLLQTEAGVMKRLGLLLPLVVFLAVLAGGCTYQLLNAQTPASGPVQISPTDSFEKQLQDFQQQIRAWERQANIQVVCILAVGAFGVAVAALQSVKKTWSTVLTVVLGIATSVFTGINSKGFIADYRSLQRAATEGHAIVRKLDGMIAVFHLRPLEGKDLVKFGEDFQKGIDDFNQIGAKLEANGGVVSATLMPETPSLPVVYAQSGVQAPAWTAKLPSDSRSFYFLGVSSDPSLATAQANSFNDAVSRASQALIPGEPYSSDKSVITSVKDVGVVQDTFLNYDVKSGAYTYYTLFRVSQAIWSFRPALTLYQRKGWRPIDLVFDPTAGLFVLDDDGAVSKATIDQQGIHLKTLFRLGGSARPLAATANAQSIFISSSSHLGCTVYQYSFTSGKTTQRLVAALQGCDGIAADGTAVYLVLPKTKEVRYWPNWESSSPQSLPFTQIENGGVLTFDRSGSQLIFVDDGNAYTISVPGRKIQQLATNVGAVRSIATSSNHILLASGKKVLFYARADHHGENPPTAMRALPGGLISGVAVDTAQSAWVTDRDNGVIQGPFPLN